MLRDTGHRAREPREIKPQFVQPTWRDGYGSGSHHIGPDKAAQAWLDLFEREGRQLRYDRHARSFSLFMPPAAEARGFALWGELTEAERLDVLECALGAEYVMSLRPKALAKRHAAVRKTLDAIAVEAAEIAKLAEAA